MLPPSIEQLRYFLIKELGEELGNKLGRAQPGDELPSDEGGLWAQDDFIRVVLPLGSHGALQDELHVLSPDVAPLLAASCCESMGHQEKELWSAMAGSFAEFLTTTAALASGTRTVPSILVSATRVSATQTHVRISVPQPGLVHLLAGLLRSLASELFHEPGVSVVPLEGYQEQGLECFVVTHAPVRGGRSHANVSSISSLQSGGSTDMSGLATAAAPFDSTPCPSCSAPPLPPAADGRGVTAPVTGPVWCRSGWAALQPFSMVVQPNSLVVLEAGAAFPLLFPGQPVVGQHVGELLTISLPTYMGWADVAGRISAASSGWDDPHAPFPLSLRSKHSGLLLQGCLSRAWLPSGAADMAAAPVLVFLGSPLLMGVGDLKRHGLHVSDLPVHSCTADLALMVDDRRNDADGAQDLVAMYCELEARYASACEQYQKLEDEHAQLLEEVAAARTALDAGGTSTSTGSSPAVNSAAALKALRSVQAAAKGGLVSAAELAVLQEAVSAALLAADTSKGTSKSGGMGKKGKPADMISRLARGEDVEIMDLKAVLACADPRMSQAPAAGDAIAASLVEMLTGRAARRTGGGHAAPPSTPAALRSISHDTVSAAATIVATTHQEPMLAGPLKPPDNISSNVSDSTGTSHALSRFERASEVSLMRNSAAAHASNTRYVSSRSCGTYMSAMQESVPAFDGFIMAGTHTDSKALMSSAEEDAKVWYQTPTAVVPDHSAPGLPPQPYLGYPTTSNRRASLLSTGNSVTMSSVSDAALATASLMPILGPGEGPRMRRGSSRASCGLLGLQMLAGTQPGARVHDVDEGGISVVATGTLLLRSENGEKVLVQGEAQAGPLDAQPSARRRGLVPSQPGSEASDEGARPSGGSLSVSFGDLKTKSVGLVTGTPPPPPPPQQQQRRSRLKKVQSASAATFKEKMRRLFKKETSGHEKPARSNTVKFSDVFSPPSEEDAASAPQASRTSSGSVLTRARSTATRLLRALPSFSSKSPSAPKPTPSTQSPFLRWTGRSGYTGEQLDDQVVLRRAASAFVLDSLLPEDDEEGVGCARDGAQQAGQADGMRRGLHTVSLSERTHGGRRAPQHEADISMRGIAQQPGWNASRAVTGAESSSNNPSSGPAKRRPAPRSRTLAHIPVRHDGSLDIPSQPMMAQIRGRRASAVALMVPMPAPVSSSTSRRNSVEMGRMGESRFSFAPNAPMARARGSTISAGSIDDGGLPSLSSLAQLSGLSGSGGIRAGSLNTTSTLNTPSAAQLVFPTVGALNAQTAAQQGSWLVTIARSPPDALACLLERVDEWRFDIFALSDVTDGRPLSVLAFALMVRTGMMQRFALHEARLARFLIRIEEGYPANPYHNRVHAADVLRNLHVIVTRGGVLQRLGAARAQLPDPIPATGAQVQQGGGSSADLLSSRNSTDRTTSISASSHGAVLYYHPKNLAEWRELLACYLTAAVHDYEHRGVNNVFLVKTGDPLAVMYNDASPMENHHVAAATRLLREPQYDFMASQPEEARAQLRAQMIEMVLATDMKAHFGIVTAFNTRLSSSQEEATKDAPVPATQSTGPPPPTDPSGPLRQLSDIQEVGSSTSSVANEPLARLGSGLQGAGPATAPATSVALWPRPAFGRTNSSIMRNTLEPVHERGPGQLPVADAEGEDALDMSLELKPLHVATSIFSTNMSHPEQLMDSLLRARLSTLRGSGTPRDTSGDRLRPASGGDAGMRRGMQLVSSTSRQFGGRVGGLTHTSHDIFTTPLPAPASAESGSNSLLAGLQLVRLAHGSSHTFASGGVGSSQVSVAAAPDAGELTGLWGATLTGALGQGSVHSGGSAVLRASSALTEGTTGGACGARTAMSGGTPRRPLSPVLMETCDLMSTDEDVDDKRPAATEPDFLTSALSTANMLHRLMCTDAPPSSSALPPGIPMSRSSLATHSSFATTHMTSGTSGTNTSGIANGNASFNSMATSMFSSLVHTRSLQRSSVASAMTGHLVDPPAPPLATLDDEARMLVWKVALKAADLGHLASPSTTHMRWVSLLEEEFFRQGDRESALGLPVSPLMDRAAGGITLSQPGFFTVVALPLYNALATYFPGCAPLVAAVKDNLAMWVAREQVNKANEGSSAAPERSAASGATGSSDEA